MHSQFYNNFKTAMLLGLLSALIILAGSFFGQQGLIIALIMAAGMNFVSYFFSDKIALATMRAQEVGPDDEVYQIIAPLAQRAGLPMPRVYVSPAAAPNAFATGRNPKHAAVCVTQGLLQVLNHDEIAGVVSHELAHVKHRDILITSVAATIAAGISYLGWMFMWGGEGDGEGSMIGGLLVLILGPVAAGIIQAAISRSREFNADKGGAKILGDPMPLARALEKIDAMSKRVPLPVSPAMNGMFIAEPVNSVGQTLMNLFSTHPPLEERLMNLIGRPSTQGA